MGINSNLNSNPDSSTRSRSFSCSHPSCRRSNTTSTLPFQRFHSYPSYFKIKFATLESLDLSNSLPLNLISLRNFLKAHVQQAEEWLKLIDICNHVETDSTRVGSSEHDESSDEDDLFSLIPCENQNPSLLSNSAVSSEKLGKTGYGFIQHVSRYINQLNADLFNREHDDPILESSSLDDLLNPSLPGLKFKEHCASIVGNLTIPDAHQLVQLLTIHTQKMQEVLSQLFLFSQYPTSLASLSFTPITFSDPFSHTLLQDQILSPTDNRGHGPQPMSRQNLLTEYFMQESDRLASLLPAFPTALTHSIAQSSNQLTNALRACKEEAQAVLHDGEVFIREEGEKLKDWVDSETESLRLALQMGASRLLTYHELPPEWKNNPFIIGGYRFIPLERWRDLLLSGLQWHNETINIHTHFLGTLSLVYLLYFLWPVTAHTDPATSTWADRLISFLFIICAMKCLVCSTAWHLFAGCGTLGPFRRLACVDYVGISGLIAASVISAEYYGLYCRPELAAYYIAFTAAMGVIGMILPFQPFFDRPESKGIRIVFFVSMACSALIPQAHMAYLYGIRETIDFYSPAIPSVLSYLSGLFFYASNWPERIRPGWVFDTLFHSHQFWHVAIVLAIWLHWKAIGSLHTAGREGFSCAAEAQEAARNSIGGWMTPLTGWII